jgi:hypothetical protein
MIIDNQTGSKDDLDFLTAVKIGSPPPPFPLTYHSNKGYLYFLLKRRLGGEAIRTKRQKKNVIFATVSCRC